MNALFLIGILAFVQGIFQIFLLQTVIRKRNTRFLFLFLALLITSITVLEYALIWAEKITLFPHILGFSFVFQFLLFPFLFFLFSPKKQTLPISLLHFLPFIVFGFYQTPFFISSAKLKLYFFEKDIINGSFYVSDLNIIITSLFIIQGVIYSYFIIKFKQQNDLLRKLKYSFILLFIVYIIYGIILFAVEKYVTFICGLLIFVLAVITYFISYLLFTNIKSITKTKSKYSGSRLSESKINDILKSLSKLEHKTEFFKDSNMRLNLLAERLDVSSHELSQAINEGLNLSFNNYLNNLRISFAEKLMSENELSLKEISFDSGFNNKTSFINAFKKKHNATPTVYLNKLKQNGQEL